MQTLKTNVKRAIESYYNKCATINSEYAKYEGKEARNTYAPILIQQKLTEKITKLKDAELERDREIEKAFLDFSNNIKPNQSVIDTQEYQVKLSNIFNLLALDPNLAESYFDFMVEANDMETLKLLEAKYKSAELIRAYKKVDKEVVIAEARTMIFVLKNYLNNDKNFTMKEVILNSIV